VLVAVDRDVDVTERVDKFAWWCVRPTEVGVQDGRDIGPATPWIFRGSRVLPPAVEFVVRIRLTTTRQRRVWILLMQAQRMFEETALESERSRLDGHAHRRPEDSILAITVGMMPPRAGRRQASPSGIVPPIGHPRLPPMARGAA
jgi:hypothetical protein